MKPIAKLGLLSFVLLTSFSSFSADTIDDVRVGPLLSTRWNQRYAAGDADWGNKCYNYYTPGEVYCGCVATAFAQVMKYHEWPTTAVTPVTYECSYNGTFTNLTMKGGVYDWANMPTYTDSKTSETEREAIGRLCYDFGVTMGAIYNKSGTAANAASAIHSLTNDFGYASSQAISFKLSSNMKEYTLENFQKMVVPSLDAGCPCVITIDGGYTHTVALDGYGFDADDNFMVHIQAGYSGAFDEWYKPDYFDIGLNTYTNITIVNFNISPKRSGAIGSGRVLNLDRTPIANARVVVTKNGVTNTVTVSNEKGIYYFWGEPGTYTVKASRDGKANAISVTLGKNQSIYAERNPDVYLDYYTPVAIGNSAWNDIVLGSAEKAAQPTIASSAGTSFVGSTVVTLSSSTQGADIYYTTDGSIPTTGSHLYNAPITINESATIKAVAIKSGLLNSAVTTVTLIESTLGQAVECTGLPWCTGGDWGSWVIDTENTYDGVDALRTAIPAAYQSQGKSCWLEAQIKGPATLSYKYAVFGYYYSPFTVMLDGETQLHREAPSWGSKTSWSDKTVDIPEGEHTIRFAFTVGQYGLPAEYDNGVWLDQMTYTYTGTDSPSEEEEETIVADPNPEDDPQPDTNADDGTGGSTSDDPEEQTGDDDSGSDEEENDPEEETEGNDQEMTGGVLPDGAVIQIGPLTKALWNQGRHYNRQSPLGLTTNPDGRRYAGCVATAVSMLLNYYQWPAQGRGTTYYNVNEQSWPYNSIFMRARFDQPYDWHAMRDTYGSVVSSRESMAVATLLADVGAVLGMEYGTSGSSTDSSKVPALLKEHFLFDDNLYDADYPYDAEEEEAIQEQLSNGHPILCSSAGSDTTAGHSYICDGWAQKTESGVTKNYYHFNFGWGGVGDGWYQLGKVNIKSTAGGSTTVWTVGRMFLRVLPQKAPQILARPGVTGTNGEIEWRIANCWTNNLTDITVERQEKTTVPVEKVFTDADWDIDADAYGWAKSGNEITAAKYLWVGYNDWPGCGSMKLWTKDGLNLSSGTTIELKYSALKFPSKVSLKLMQCVYNSAFDGYDVYVGMEECKTLKVLPGGTSSTTMTEQTVTISGSDIISAFGGAVTDMHLCFLFVDENGDTTYSAGTEVFHLTSFKIMGTAEEWRTVDGGTTTYPATQRTHAYTGLAEKNHRFKVTANYADGKSAAGTAEQLVSSTAKVPAITVSGTTKKTVSFTVSDADDFSCGFEKQINDLAGSANKSGNVVTYTFTSNDVATVGTHWLTLYVTNTATMVGSKYVYFTNPPNDHPLNAIETEDFADAKATAAAEGKHLLLVATGEPDNIKFKNMAAVLSSNEVVTAASGKFIITEALFNSDAGENLLEQYWTPQSAGDAISPTRAYLIVINPSTNEAVGQYDITSLAYMSTLTKNVAAFLNRDFGEITPSDPDPDPIVPVEDLTMMYFNRLNGGDSSVTVPTGTYGSINVSDHAYYAKAFTARETLTNGASSPERGGNYANIIQKISANTDIVTHTVAGWFKVTTLPTATGDANATDIYFARSHNGDHGGYKVSVDSTGALLVGKINNVTWNIDGSGIFKSAASVVKANTWFHLGVSVTKSATERQAVPRVFVNGAEVTMTGSSNYFKTNLNGNNCSYFEVGAGLSAAGIYVDTAALTNAATFVALATNETYVAVQTVLDPTIQGGDEAATIAKNDEDEYVVTPKDAITAITIENAGENTIVVPPGVATVVGVEAAHLKVKHGSHDISSAFNTTGDASGLTLVLGEGNSVTVGSETITVRPVLAVKEGDDLVGSVPFVVTSGAATMGVKSIPGLKYTLLRGTTPGSITENCGTFTADSSRVRLQDTERPTGGAFYRVEVTP